MKLSTPNLSRKSMKGGRPLNRSILATGMIIIKIAFYIQAVTVLFFTTLCQQQQK